jgi:hypothetical protein
MTVRRTPQHEAILELRRALADAGMVLVDTDPDVLPGALRDARELVARKLSAAQGVGVGR